jgi:hypothetical protein
MRISGHVSGTGPLSLPPQLQRAAAQPAKTEAAQTPEQTEKTPQDENKSRAFNQTPMEEVRTTAFARDQKASLAAVQEIGRLMESNETEASTETESEEAISESEAPEETEETAETEETEAPEGEGEVEEAPEFEADEPEAEESEESGETGEDLLEQDESAGPEYEQPEIDLDGLLRAAVELKKKPTFALAESWTLFTAF